MSPHKEIKTIKVPRFNRENGYSTTISRSLLMSKIKSKNTSPEVSLRKAIWKSGYRYTLHNKKLPGNPDIVLKKHRVIIFVDGEFWHGYEWEKKKQKINSNRSFWIPKIERNMQRDQENNEKLQDLGYKVFRFWDRKVNKDLDGCVQEIISYLLTLD